MALSRSEAGRLGALASRETQARNKALRVAAYAASPTCCTYCNKALSYSQRKNRFCNQSCAASYNNLGVTHNPRKVRPPCIRCGTPLPRQHKKFCDNSCRLQYNTEEVEKFINDQNSLGIVNSNRICSTNKAVKKLLIRALGEKCQQCGWAERNPKSGNVPIEVEHKDGNSTNNQLVNLTLLCPNCHSLSPTYKGLNRGNGRHSRMERYYAGKSW